MELDQTSDLFLMAENHQPAGNESVEVPRISRQRETFRRLPISFDVKNVGD
jgi:hypothetical protein